MRIRFKLLAASLTLAGGVCGAFAHVTLETRQAKAGRAYKAVFKVPHGCEGSPTVKVRIDIPEGVIAVKPMPKSGWTIDLVKGAYAGSYAFHGDRVREGVRQVTWAGGPLPDDYYDEFVLSAFVAKEIGGGRALYFPVTQECETGEVRWSQIPADGQDPHALDAPAPRLMLVDERADPASQVSAGSLRVENAWSRATPGGADVAAGYLKVTNAGTAPDVLVGGSAAIAGAVEVHEMKESDGVMQMRRLPDGIEIKPGETVELKPGGLHLMFLGVKEGLKTGQSFRATLQFKSAGAVEVEFSVAPIGAPSPEPTHHH